MNTLIKSHNDKMNRLVNVSQARRSVELDFFAHASNKYRQFINSPSSYNPNEDESLLNKVKDYFIEEAQDPLEGVIAKQTKLNIDIKNLTQTQIKKDKKYIDNYFNRLENIIQLGGYLASAIQDVTPENLSTFIANYDNININGTNERVKDRNMFMLAGWSDLFNYFDDVKCIKDFYFTDSKKGEIIVFSQEIRFLIKGETFRKYLHKKPYIVDDFLADKNIKTGEDGKKYYCVYGEVDSTQLDNDDILYLYINDVPQAMNLGELFETAGVTQNSTLQPQYFLGGSFLDPNNPDDPNTDTSIKVPMYSVVNDQVKRFFVKPINTEAINQTPVYNAEVQSHIAGLFAVAGGNISVLSGYSNKRLGLDLPLGINESVTPELSRLYESLSPEGKASFVGNRYAFNKTGFDDRYISMIDAQKAYMMSTILQSNLDKKLPQKNIPGQPSIVRDVTTDKTQQGRDLIKALNDNGMPIPEFYANMLGITEWQAGMPVYYQKLPEQVNDLPTERTEDIKAFVEQYS